MIIKTVLTVLTVIRGYQEISVFPLKYSVRAMNLQDNASNHTNCPLGHGLDDFFFSVGGGGGGELIFFYDS